MVPPPLTWDPKTPMPSPAHFEDVKSSTERTPMFEPSDFGDDEELQTVVTTAAYDLRPKFTGRSVTIRRLGELIDRAFDKRELAFAVVTGDAGSGKSRLVGELIARVKARHGDAIVITGADDGQVYGPIARALAARYGIGAADEVGDARDRLEAGVRAVLPPARTLEVVHLVAHLMRIPFDDSPVLAPLLEAPQRLEARAFMALKRLIAAEAERAPLLIVLENLETAGAETVNLISYLAAGLRDARIAILATGTTKLVERHPSFGDGEVAPTRIELGALTALEAEELLRELCKQLADVPPKLVDHVRGLGGSAAASPRTIHELVRLLLESDVIVREGLMWRVDAKALAATTLPKTYDALVAARLRVMDATERRVLEMAAAVGETSWLDAILAIERSTTAIGAAGFGAIDADGPTLAQIAASGDHSRVAVVAAVGKLVEHEWLSESSAATIPGERELRFASPNLWQLVYAGIDEPRRRTYHATVARWHELHPEGRGAAAQEEVAHHLALAGEAREAAVRYRRAAEFARAQFANERAIRLYDRALACFGAGAPGDLATRIQLWHDLGSIYELIGDFEAALGAFERMLRLSWVFASKTKAAVAFNKMGRVWRRRGDLRLALEYLERGLELFRSAADARGIAGSLDDIGKSLQMLGRYDEAHAKITEALQRRGKGGDPRSIATSLSRLGEVQTDRGQYESALTCHQEALELRQKAGDRWGVAVSHNNLAALAFELGDPAGARTGWLSALAEAEGIGALPLTALILTNLGELALATNAVEEARSRLDNALEIIDDIEDRGLESECCRHLAQLEAHQGHPTEARELAERALTAARKTGLREKEAQAQITLGDVLSASLYDAGADAGEPMAAAAYSKGVEILRSIHNDAALGRALLSYGRFKAESGQIADGKDLLRDALAVFSRLGLAKPAQDVTDVLSKLG
jgi:tetratricopeptide (TPR) repeat protein|nr:tetratricopeptide repeat protein [Kofleriaceae bacterium]